MASREREPRRRWALGAVVAACAAIGTGTALAAFPQDPPDDPAYNPAEQGGPATCAQKSVNSEQHYLYGFMPQCSPQAADTENAAGMSVDKAWAKYTTGDPRSVIAYIEGGINWHHEPDELANRVFLNKGELPKPTTRAEGKKTCAAGALCAADYSDTPDANGNGLVDPEDIIKRFSDGADDDGNGYVDDISGWDFYDDQNDPATVDSTYDHANGQQEQAAAQTNNGIGTAGICPSCMVMPIKAGAEALDRTDDLAQAWLYATDMHVDVLVSVTADLGYSSFMDQAVRYAWKHNVVMVEASNDFDSTDHQGGMFHPYVLPGNGVVANSQIAAADNPGANAITTTYRARSGYTSWGTHNVFSGATQGGTTSESTPTVGGVMALVRAYSRKAARQGLIKGRLTNDEAIQVVRSTVSDIASNPNPPQGWPAKPGWDLQYGYGRPNVLKAMDAVHDGKIPPVGWITKPAWYSLYDPMKRNKVAVSGHVAAPRSQGYRWRLQFAPGAEPGDKAFRSAGTGRGTKPVTGRLGSLNLAKLPKSFWNAAYELSGDKELSTSESYTVTLRLRVYDAKGRMAEDRRTIAVHHDPSLLHGFPRRIGPGGESQPQIADLQARGHGALVFGDSDGRVHALDGRTGKELPGWPVHTRPTVVTKSHRGVDPGYEPIVNGVAVGDLNGDGRLEVVATSTTGRVYAWSSRGKLMRGWPKTLHTGVKRPKIPRPALEFTRLPIQGASAPPVLYDLNGDGKLEILQSAWDGHLYAWKANGKRLQGWPVDPTLGPGYVPSGGNKLVNDQKIDLPPAIADLDGDGKPEVVVKAQDNEVPDAGLQPGGAAHLHAFHANGSKLAGWPITQPSLIMYYGSAQEFITEGVSGPTVADTDGDGKDEVAFAPGIFSPTYSFHGDGSPAATYAPTPASLFPLFTDPNALFALIQGGALPDDAPVNFTTTAAFGKVGTGGLALVEPMSGGATTAYALLAPGGGSPINSYMAAFDAASQAPLAGFPSLSQGLDFLGAPVVADVTGDGRPEVIEGGDSSALHAFTEGGGQAAGFPKFTTGWILWGPSVGDLNGDGRTDVVAATREGYVMAWKTKGNASAGDDEWWSYRHDDWNSGRYGVDSRPPGKLSEARSSPNGRKLTFRAPGDDWYAGKVDHYVVVTRKLCGSGKERTARVKGQATAGARQSLKAPKNEVVSRGWAVDDAGNRGPAYVVPLGACSPGRPAQTPSR